MATTSAAAGSHATSDLLAAIGRLMLATIFLWSGYGKFTDQPYALGYIQSINLPTPEVALWAAIAVELLGGLALAVGFKARLVAAGLAVFCIASALLFHTAFEDPNQLINFFKNIALAGGLLQVVAFGPGSRSLDDFLEHPRSADECRNIPG